MNPNELFQNMITGKRVALVGPGRTQTDNHDYIENCDTVVRCGQTLPILNDNEKFYGSRTDVVYNSLDNSKRAGGDISMLLEIWRINNVKLVCNCCPKAEFFYMRDINKHSQDYIYRIVDGEITNIITRV